MAKTRYLIGERGYKQIQQMVRLTRNARRPVSINYAVGGVQPRLPGDPFPRNPGGNKNKQVFARLTSTLTPTSVKATFKILAHSNVNRGELVFSSDAPTYDVYPGIYGKKAWYPSGLQLEVQFTGQHWFLCAGQGYSCLVGTLAGDLTAGGTAEVDVPDLPEEITTKPTVKGYGIDTGKKFPMDRDIGINWEQSKGEWVIDWIEGCAVDA